MSSERAIRIFDKQANSYEKRRKKLQHAAERSRLLRHAEGKVLEVSVGAGNNFAFYPKGVQVVAADFSIKMIEKARVAAEDYDVDCEFFVSDVENLDFEENTFDTIVSTLSLCAYQHPEFVLQQFQKWAKPEAKVLLFEHGISTNSPYAWLQNRLDGLSMRLIGCHQNRDILQLMNNAGLQVDHLERMFLGSVYLIQASVNKEEGNEERG
ncbi:class I SAM-dependent methyltransferase [Ammoniphilus sp. CFH 90114]|uniref:class I SAM-dependent methyltransferase n=1 Tax=Ammoniphilus sp. CFH 90114 TaxID=2493665 RepID=UPI0013E963B7|nr:class I SAM-dependent methyltransferase [Ammoniphilus sp. CFH 90114]